MTNRYYYGFAVRKVLMICMIMFFYYGRIFSQTITYDTTINGWNAKVTMRSNMNSTTDSVQGIIFIPGTGECGTDINKLLIYGPHYWMTKGWDGSVQLSNGKHYPIIISLQPPVANQRPWTTKKCIDAILKRYRIKRNSLHLTGISQGGWMVNQAATYKATANDYSYYNAINSVVNVQGVVPDDTYDASLPYPKKMGNWAKYGGKELWFEQTNDNRNMSTGAANMNDSVSGSATYIKTDFGSGGHSDFEKFYDPSANQWININANVLNIVGVSISAGTNIYQWMLLNGDTSLGSGSVTPPPPPPVQLPTAVAGANQVITLPISSVTLDASGSTGTITSYSWKKLSGGSATIVNALGITTLVTGLTAGTYVFELTLNGGSTSTVQVTVNPAVVIQNPVTPPVSSGNHVIIGLGEYQSYIISTQGKLYGISSSASAVGTGSSAGVAVPPVAVKVPSNLTFTTVASGLHHSLAVDNNGEVWTWGWNEVGQAGDGSSVSPIYTPVKIPQDSIGNPFNGIIQVASYYSYNAFSGNVALKSDGTVWVWGNTGGGMRGNGTDGQINNRPVQVIIPGNRQITKIVAAEVILALASDGTVWSWGGGGFRTMNLGSGSSDYRSPHQVINLPSTIKDIAGASSYYYAITSTGVPYGWGYLGVYMGVGTDYANNTPITTPRNLSSDLNLPAPIASIVCNTVSTHVILTDGTLWGWGDNAVGAIGIGTELDFSKYNPPYAWSMGPGQLMQTKPVQILPEITNFTHVFGGTAYVFYTYALTADGKLYSWGRNKGGVLGNGVIGATSSIGADYPNSWDVPLATLVDPLSLVKNIVQTSPTCLSNPSATSCSFTYSGAPVVSAGISQTITLPLNQVMLSGLSTNMNGVNYEWSKISGPTQFKIESPTQTLTQVTNLSAGVYVFKFKVTDQNGTSTSDTVTVTVNGTSPVIPNQAPVAKAGANVTITLPTNTTTLNGSQSTDIDGNIVSYKWTKVSGPSTFTIVSSTTSSTNLTSLIAGTYGFELEVTDNQGAIGKDTVAVIVNTAPNKVPVAKAGTDMTITLPTNSVTVDGGQSIDTDGSIASYKWTKISGPSTFTIVSSITSSTNLTGLVAGTYGFELEVTDNQGAKGKDTVAVIVNAAPNIAPMAKAGADMTITLPTNSVTVDGSQSTDADGSIASYKWTKVSGPSTFTIASSATVSTKVNGLVEGTYNFELAVTDNKGAIDKDTVTIIVNPAPVIPNQAPVAYAGTDITITLPTSNITLDGSNSSDADGSISSYKWNKVTGPNTFTITNNNSVTTTVTNLVEGSYSFELVVTDNKGAIAKDTVDVTVKPAVVVVPPPPVNQAPISNAGNDVTITLPVNSVTLDGSSSYDPDGTISSYSWSKISGPNPFTILNSNTVNPSLPDLQAGTYVFELTVQDDKGATASNRVTVTVNAAVVVNRAPNANAGQGRTISLPVSTVSLDGSASSDEDGTISSYKWKQLSGPADAIITSSNAVQTSVSGLVEGEYVFELSVTDNDSAVATSTVKVIVVYDTKRTAIETISIYPVPATTTLNFNYQSDNMREQIVISIFDTHGHLVLSQKFEKNLPILNKAIAVTSLKPGIYFFYLRSDKGKRIMRKFIKQ